MSNELDSLNVVCHAHYLFNSAVIRFKYTILPESLPTCIPVSFIDVETNNAI